MKTDSKTVAQFLATVIWADGGYSEPESECLRGIAKDYELETLEADIDYWLFDVIDRLMLDLPIEADVDDLKPKITNAQSDVVSDILADAARLVDPEEKDGILALCLQLMGCDGYLADEEISNFYVIANILGIDKKRAQLLLSELTEDDETLLD